MKRKNAISLVLAVAMLTAAILPGCGAEKTQGKRRLRSSSTNQRQHRISIRWRKNLMRLMMIFI